MLVLWLSGKKMKGINLAENVIWRKTEELKTFINGIIKV